MTTRTSDFFLNDWRCSSPGEMTKPFQQLKLTTNRWSSRSNGLRFPTNRWPSCWRRMKFPRNGGEQAIQTGWCFQQTGKPVIWMGWCFQQQVTKPFKQLTKGLKTESSSSTFWREVTFISSQMQFNRINNKEYQPYLTGQQCCEMRI